MDPHSFPTRRSSDLLLLPPILITGIATPIALASIPVSYDAGIEAKAIGGDRKSKRLNSSHANISYAVFCLKKKKCTSAHYQKAAPGKQWSHRNKGY